MKLWIIGLLFTGLVLGEAPGKGRSSDLNTNPAGSNLGPTYGETNSQRFPNSTTAEIGGVSYFSLYNGSSLGSVGVAFPKSNETCSSVAAAYFNTQEWTVPASTGFTPPKGIAIGKHVCLRSKTGSSLTSGTISLVVW